jgi:hypothetical protein
MGPHRPIMNISFICHEFILLRNGNNLQTFFSKEEDLPNLKVNIFLTALLVLLVGLAIV